MPPISPAVDQWKRLRSASKKHWQRLRSAFKKKKKMNEIPPKTAKQKAPQNNQIQHVIAIPLGDAGFRLLWNIFDGDLLYI